jgi:class 3 adenylate cyclase
VSRATATVLFTDLVGSTELRGRLGEEAADELRRKHDQLLAQAVDANNGRIVKGLGDGIMATFTGASDAVTAAVAIQQALDRLNRSGKVPVPLAVRVGLSAGDVTFEDDDVHGTPVIEASRLCATANGAEILAAEVVRILAGEHDYVAVGPLELKGLDHPVSAVRVGWEPVAVSGIPMPALLTDVGRIFVGRDAELERLCQLWKEAVAGERRVALLAGEPGVGKTSLAAELAMRVHGEGGVVLAGRCDEDLEVPYQAFIESLRHFIDHSPPVELKERLGRYGGELVRLVPELSERVGGLSDPLRSDPEMERYRLFDGVAGWLSALSAEEALLLVLDDLQWAAKPTLLLLWSNPTRAPWRGPNDAPVPADGPRCRRHGPSRSPRRRDGAAPTGGRRPARCRWCPGPGRARNGSGSGIPQPPAERRLPPLVTSCVRWNSSACSSLSRIGIPNFAVMARWPRRLLISASTRASIGSRSSDSMRRRSAPTSNRPADAPWERRSSISLASSNEKPRAIPSLFARCFATSWRQA